MWFRWKPYVPVAKRRANSAAYARTLAAKEKRTLSPVTINGRKIAATFWGGSWCDNLEAYSDFANRLPRGRTYVRNGSVIDLQIERGQIKALVSGSEVYRVTIEIATLTNSIWTRVKDDCARSIDSMLDLLAGRFDESVMTRLTRRDDGLFPKPREIQMKCSCPDWAVMCKHCAAVLYGIGARLDKSPEMLFTLRGVDHTELIGQAVSAENLDRALVEDSKSAVPADDLGAIFGIDLVNETAQPVAPPRPTRHHLAPAKSVRSATAKAGTVKKRKEKVGRAKKKSRTTTKSKRPRSAAGKS
jgi:uncharacterized Zn finger protein